MMAALDEEGRPALDSGVGRLALVVIAVLRKADAREAGSAGAIAMNAACFCVHTLDRTCTAAAVDVCLVLILHTVAAGGGRACCKHQHHAHLPQLESRSHFAAVRYYAYSAGSAFIAAVTNVTATATTTTIASATTVAAAATTDGVSV